MLKCQKTTFVDIYNYIWVINVDIEVTGHQDTIKLFQSCREVNTKKMRAIVQRKGEINHIHYSYRLNDFKSYMCVITAKPGEIPFIWRPQ